MARRCELTGMGSSRGTTSRIPTLGLKRVFAPKPPEGVALRSTALQQSLGMRITTRALRTVQRHGGIDAYLLSTANERLAPEGLPPQAADPEGPKKKKRRESEKSPFQPEIRNHGRVVRRSLVPARLLFDRLGGAARLPARRWPGSDRCAARGSAGTRPSGSPTSLNLPLGLLEAGGTLSCKPSDW